MTGTLRWFKSGYSDAGGGECLEVAPCPHATTLRIRGSKNPGGPTLAVSGEAWSVFLPTVPTTLPEEL